MFETQKVLRHDKFRKGNKIDLRDKKISYKLFNSLQPFLNDLSVRYHIIKLLFQICKDYNE